jgi:hypothetical protein
MSDSSQINLPISQALTSDMMLGLKPAAPKSRSYRISVAPINKNVFKPNDQMVFELPTSRRGSWYDATQSFIKFSVQATTTAEVTQAVADLGNAVNLDNSAYSFIQRLDVYNSSNLLESINEYGQLANMLIDTSLTSSDKAGLSAMIGTNNQTKIVGQGGANYAVNSVNIPVRSPGDRSGLSIRTHTPAQGIDSAPAYTFCLPLLSGVVGISCNKMIPVGKLTNPIRLEFYLSANDDAVFYGLPAAGCTWQIVNVEICACYVEILDDNFNSFDRNEEYISTTTYKHTSSMLPAATSGEVNFLLPFRAASITGLYARFLPFSGNVQGATATASYRKGASINPNFSQISYRIGSSIYPNKPIYLKAGNQGSGSEGYAELLKSFHALSSSIGNSAIRFDQYNVASTATANTCWTTPIGNDSGTGDNLIQTIQPGTSNNAFCLGLECQSFSNRNDTILSGISTLNSQIFFNGVVYSGETCGGANTFDIVPHFFASMDMILVIDSNGVMSAKY